jgi:uncharacterized membrane protein YfcA
VRGYRRELYGQGEQMRRLGAVACGGAVVGVWLLAVSSTDTFRAVVPFLLILACVMIAAQQRVAAWIHAGRSRRRVRRGLDLAQFAAGAYGASFGAGLGVMLGNLLRPRPAPSLVLEHPSRTPIGISP